jgi:galactokinase/mevalonate kinase-like predicted kinase
VAAGCAPLVTANVANAAGQVEPQADGVAEAATPAPSPSAAAQQLALTMRRFDATLTDKQIHDIAKSFDDGWKTGRRLHKGLSNGDPPSPPFEVGE